MLAALALGSLSPASASDDAAARTFFPTDVLFDPLIADPKQPRSYVTLQSFDIDARDRFTAGVVAFGETFGLVRWPGDDDATAWQVSIDGAVFAQFDMDSDSRDLLNADYMVGASAEHRRGRNALRLRFYHQSSHLGDEFLLNNPDLPFERLNFSYESLQLIGAHSRGAWRLYGGGEVLVNRNPPDFERGVLQAGVEYRGERRRRTGLRPVGGIDVRSFEHHDWEPSFGLKLGAEFGAEDGPTRRRVRLLLEAYDGFVPYGQFYDLELKSYGFGFYFGF